MGQIYLKSQAFLETEKSPAEEVFSALARAEDRVSRLDERGRSSGFVEGWRARADVRAVIAALAIEGQLIHPEDLLLRAADADTRLPDPSVTRAYALLRGRQRAVRGGAELLSWQGLSWLCGLTRLAPPPGSRPTTRLVEPADAGLYEALAGFFEDLTKREAETPRAGVEECLSVLDLDVQLPSLLHAAAFLEAWRIVDPLPSHRPLGAMAAADPAGRGEPELLPTALGQPCLQFPFQQRKLPAGRLPGEAKVTGGGGEAAGLGQIAKHLESLQLHRRFYAKSGRRRQPVNGPGSKRPARRRRNWEFG